MEDTWEPEGRSIQLPEACGAVLLMEDDGCGQVLLWTEGGLWLFHPDSGTLTEYPSEIH